MPPEPGTLTRRRPDVITTTGGLHAIMGEWTALWERCPDATPFQRPEWVLPWWQQFGRGGLWVLTKRDDSGQLVGIAPLYLHRHDGLATVRLVGAGLSDYLDVLALPGWGRSMAALIEEALTAHPERWDTAEFQQLTEGSALLATSGACGDETVAGEPCPYVPLLRGEDSGAGAAGSARLWENVAADRRRLERRFGTVTFERATPETAPAMLERMRELHSRRWGERGGSGVLADDHVWAFQRTAGAALVAAGVARLYAYRAAGDVVGIYYGFLQRERASYYLSGFDPEYAAFGIGNQLVACGMAEAAREGATCFDLLRGCEPYKYRWGAIDRATYCRRLYRDPVLRRGAPEVFQPRVTPTAPTPAIAGDRAAAEPRSQMQRS